MTNILCIDYGLKRIGLAYATTPLAEPIGVVHNDHVKDDPLGPKVIAELLKIVADFHIEKILVGVPEGPVEQHARACIKELKEHVGIPIEPLDETLSSHTAGEHMRLMKKSKKHGARDHLAAAVMLQEYLDLS